MARIQRPFSASEPIPWIVVTIVCMAVAATGFGHDEESRTPIIIDTDLGIDDAVAAALALQHPHLEIAAVVASEGVAESATATDHLGRLLDFFNRADVPLFAAMRVPPRSPPECRDQAAAMIEAALPEPSQRTARGFSPSAYVVDGARSTVLVLGPLTQLAAALSEEPRIAGQISRIVVAGDPEQSDSWNLEWDRVSVAAVQNAGVPMIFVRPGDSAAKPAAWIDQDFRERERTSLGDQLLDRLLATDQARTHYLEKLTSFHDELAVMFLAHPEHFNEVAKGIVEPKNDQAAVDALIAALSRGRQRKDRVVFVDGPLPAGVLQKDVAARRIQILANNGPDEWFAQLLLNELHEHLGAYSIIGVKMGLRAAELLNAPQHSMRIVSAAPPTQPVSCLNDGLLVSTGSTPGRGLFNHVPGPSGTVEAAFEFNGRTITLRLRDEYRERIRLAIQDLLGRFTLEDDAYWIGVRALGLDIWQDWHRRDLFEVTPANRLPGHAPKGGEQ
jgi:inosine-uridine nucleoside N-ribohydrolase